MTNPEITKQVESVDAQLAARKREISALDETIRTADVDSKKGAAFNEAVARRSLAQAQIQALEERRAELVAEVYRLTAADRSQAQVRLAELHATIAKGDASLTAMVDEFAARVSAGIAALHAAAAEASQVATALARDAGEDGPSAALSELRPCNRPWLAETNPGAEPLAQAAGIVARQRWAASMAAAGPARPLSPTAARA